MEEPAAAPAPESAAGSYTEGAQALADSGGGSETIQLQTTLPGTGGGASPAREDVSAARDPDAAHANEGPTAQSTVAHSIVAPGGAPTVGGGANTCTPDPAGSTLVWDVVDAGAQWQVSVTSFTLAGRIQLNPWPSNPTTMTVPNTPNPVDGGNIGDAAGNNHWQYAMDDLANYDTAGGGAGPHWHDTAASRAHEYAHWNEDYIGDAVTTAAGGNWAAVNARIDALVVPKAGHADAAAARVALTPLVNAELTTWRRATIRRWNAIISTTDTPGGGGRGYAAGARVLAGHITRIRAYKDSKGWGAGGGGRGGGGGAGGGGGRPGGGGGGTP
jgi:hypothetical protein